MSWNAKRYRLTRHHNLAKSRQGKDISNNIIYLTAERHQLLHKIFGNLTISEIIQVLQRLERMKDVQHT